MSIDTENFSQWVVVGSIAVPLIVAVFTGLWAVWVRSQENKRAEWRRVEELINIVHNGATQGVWGQKLAVDELMSLRRPRKYFIPILREASAHFRRSGPMGIPVADHIDLRLSE